MNTKRHIDAHSPFLTKALLALLLASCSGGDEGDDDDFTGPNFPDGGADVVDGGGNGPDAMPGTSADAMPSSQLDSTLTSNCAGLQERAVVTSPGFELHGNHCWFDNPGASGSVTISDYRPSEGIVRAEFNALSLRSCVGASVCTINGSIETTGQGVYE